jgi:tRNA modification GTPase
MDEVATIYALGTPLPSRAHPGALSVIRLSGPRVADALVFLTERKAFERGHSVRDPALPEPRRMTVRSVYDPLSGEVIDRGLIVWFEAPNSETGEHMAELHLHGGRAVVNGALDAIQKLGFCRLAEPGEFTRRAVRASQARPHPGRGDRRPGGVPKPRSSAGWRCSRPMALCTASTRTGELWA